MKAKPLCAAMVVATAAWAAEPAGRLYPSRRCGECHGRQRDEWNTSPHAQAAGPRYTAALEHLDAPAREACEGCHVPLTAAGPRVLGDGVGCDACHTATGPAKGGGLKLEPEQARRFGPYRDSKDHHFHRVGYSEFVAEGTLCTACHEDAPHAGLKTYTTVSEWKAVKGAKGCLDCHMPTFTAIAAKGEHERTVAHHVFRAELAEAISLKVLPAPSEIKVELTNTGADHAVPSGRPERRLKLSVTFLDKAGAELASEVKRLGRFLVDEKGNPAPSFAAVREAQDSRLFPRQPWRTAFAAPKGAARAQVRLWYEAFDPAFAQVFDAADVDPRLVVERTEALSNP